MWLAKHNPSEMGFAAMVDFDSIWAFADSELQDSSSWINDMEKSWKIGFKGGKIDAIYMHSMGQKYPPVFVGKEKNITSTTTIKMLELFEHWQGNGMGDGYKASLTKTLQTAMDRHHAYCMDHVPAGVVRDMALRMAKATMRFRHALVAYLDDEYSMLTSFNLLPKHILLLLSNQVVQICDNLFDYRNKVVTTDISNQLVTAARFGWVTLQAQGCTESYLREQFRRHPGINSSFIHFLTRHMAD